jgi:uncharacterized protein (DUF952 family)
MPSLSNANPVAECAQAAPAAIFTGSGVDHVIGLIHLSSSSRPREITGGKFAGGRGLALAAFSEDGICR